MIRYSGPRATTCIGDCTEATLPADGYAPRGAGDVRQDGAYHLPLGGAVRGFGNDRIIAGKADGAENVIRVKATTEGFPGETNFPSSARTGVSIRSMPGMRMSRRC